MANMLRPISIDTGKTKDFQISAITAICEYQKSLCIGLVTGHVIPLVYNSNSNAIPFKLPNIIPQPYEGTIHGLAAIQNSPHWLFIHQYTRENAPYKVIYRHEDGQEVELIKEASLFAVGRNPNRPAVVSALQNKIQIFQFMKDKDEFGPPLTKDALSEVQAVDINENAVVYYANGRYRACWYPQSVNSITDVANVYLKKPIVLAFSEINFLVCLSSAIILTGRQGEKQSASVLFNKGIDKIVSNQFPNFFYLYHDRVFEFFDNVAASAVLSFSRMTESFKSIPISHVRLACSVNDTLILITENGMNAYGGTPRGVQLATKAMESEANLQTSIEQLSMEIKNKKNNPEANDIIVDMFKTLWEHEKFYDAIHILTEVDWPYDCREIISLFPCFMLANPLESRIKLIGTKVRESPSEKELGQVGTYLLRASKAYRKRNNPADTNQLSILDTCLFEIFAMTHKTRELDELLKRQNSVDVQLVQQFFNKNLKQGRMHPALAVYYTRTEKHQEALVIWKSLNDAAENTTRWALEASYTLQDVQNVNHTLIEENLSWIVKRSKEAAVNSFLYPDVPANFAIQWIEKNCKEYLIKFLDYYTQLPSPKNDLIERTLQIFCTMLKELEKASIDLTQMTFSKAAMDYVKKAKDKKPKPNPELNEAIAKEICEKVIKIIKNPNNKLIKLNNYVEIINKTKQRALLFEFYSIGEMYDEAITLVFKSPKINFDELENFCRNAPNPEKAFSCTFNKIKDKNEIVVQYQKFLLDNIEWIDLNAMMDWIPDKTKLKDVDNLLRTTENILIEKQRIAQLRVDIAKSMKIDVDYRSVRAQVRNAEVQHNTICQSCNRPVGNGWLAIAPDNRVYHITCKPDLNPK